MRNPNILVFILGMLGVTLDSNGEQTDEGRLDNNQFEPAMLTFFTNSCG